MVYEVERVEERRLLQNRCSESMRNRRERGCGNELERKSGRRGKHFSTLFPLPPQSCFCTGKQWLLGMSDRNLSTASSNTKTGLLMHCTAYKMYQKSVASLFQMHIHAGSSCRQLRTPTSVTGPRNQLHENEAGGTASILWLAEKHFILAEANVIDCPVIYISVLNISLPVDQLLTWL